MVEEDDAVVGGETVCCMYVQYAVEKVKLVLVECGDKLPYSLYD